MKHSYKVLNVHSEEVFERDFKDSTVADSVDFNGDLSELQALRAVNNWNKDNGPARLVYWVE